MKVVEYILVVIFMQSMSLQAMLIPLNALEKSLVMKEIERRGVDVVSQEIDEVGEPAFVQNSSHCGFYIPTALEITMELYKKERDMDLFTGFVFEQIAQREERYDYGEEFIVREDGSVVAPVCYLSDSLETKYWWKRGSDKSVVIVTALLRNKAEIQQLIESYRKEY